MAIDVVYLDDEEDLCDVFRDLFSSDDTVVTTFTDPVAFLDAMAARSPAIVFLDYRLPGTNGELIAAKLDPSWPKVLVTGEFRATSDGLFVKVLLKPFRAEEVRSLIAELGARTSATD